MRLPALLILLFVLAACSDRIPPPATPTPSPRPGYPPPVASELPEGALFVSNPSLTKPRLFRLEVGGSEAAEIGPLAVTSVSPDGARAVAVVMGPGRGAGLPVGMGILSASGFEEIESSPQIGRPSVVWSRDGRSLAYTLPDEANQAKSRIWSLDTESGEKKLLATQPDTDVLLGWTTFGDVLVLTQDGLGLLGERPRTIALPADGEIVDAALSADGRSVAVELGGYEQDAQTELTYIRGNGIWMVELDSGRWREIVDLEGGPPMPQTTKGVLLIWSPDARRLAYHSGIGSGWPYDRFGLDIIDVVTGEQTHVLDRPEAKVRAR